nr:hypothetical protein GCM10020092_090940 [Actinoplanes digitatis]
MSLAGEVAGPFRQRGEGGVRPLGERFLRVRVDDEAVEHQHDVSVRTPGKADVTTPKSENLLRRLARVNPTVAFIAALAVLLAGLFLPGIIGAALLFVLWVALVALALTTWPVQTTPVRVVRATLLVLLLAAVVAKLI